MNYGCFCCKLLNLFEQPFRPARRPYGRMTTLWQNSTYGYQCTRIKDYLSIPRQHPSVKPIFRKIRVNLNEPFNILMTNPVKLHLVESKFYFLQKGRRNRGLVSMAVKASISYRFVNCYYRHDLWCSNKG